MKKPVKTKFLNSVWLELLVALSFQSFLLAAIRIFWRTNFMLEQLALVALVSIFLVNLTRKRFHLENRYRTAVTLLLIFNLLAFTVGNVQRSTSLYVISWVGDYKDNGVSVKVLENKLIQRDGSVDSVGLEQRINEHRKRHLITIQNNGKASLTKGGELVLLAAKTLAYIFNLDLWKDRTNFINPL